jgi:hypothetical protein
MYSSKRSPCKVIPYSVHTEQPSADISGCKFDSVVKIHALVIWLTSPDCNAYTVSRNLAEISTPAFCTEISMVFCASGKSVPKGTEELGIGAEGEEREIKERGKEVYAETFSKREAEREEGSSRNVQGG